MKKGLVIFIVLILVGINIMFYNFYIRPLFTMSAHKKSETKTSNITWWQAQSGLESRGLSIVRGEKESIKLTVEVAKTFEQRTMGLMFRKSLEENHGMLFIFEDEVVRKFWMKNTYISLDLLFIGSDWLIKHIHNNAVPLDLSSLSSQEPVQYVIEVNSDFVEKNDIKIGDKIEGI